MKKLIDKKEIKSFNLYYKQLCFIAIAIIWLFTGGYLGEEYEGGWILYAFITIIFGLLVDFTLQIFRVFKRKFLILEIVKLVYFIFQIIVIAFAYIIILIYLIKIYSQFSA